MSSWLRQGMLFIYLKRILKTCVRYIGVLDTLSCDGALAMGKTCTVHVCKSWVLPKEKILENYMVEAVRFTCSSPTVHDRLPTERTVAVHSLQNITFTDCRLKAQWRYTVCRISPSQTADWRHSGGTQCAEYHHSGLIEIPSFRDVTLCRWVQVFNFQYVPTRKMNTR